MKKRLLVLGACAALTFSAVAEGSLGGPALLSGDEPLRFTADRMAVDNVTKAAVASGHVHAVAGVMSLRSNSLVRDDRGVVRFDSSTTATTCTNDCGHQHWNISGAVEYQAKDHVLVEDAWLRFCEIPVFYFPYLWYPLDTDCGFSWMPGWTSEWGAYLMTKYSMHLLGDPDHADETAWLKGATRADIREELGFALGEDLEWSLNEFGKGRFKVYYAWDWSDNYGSDGIYDDDYNYSNWGSTVPENRYALEFAHRWEATERDILRVKGAYFSDSYFRDDYFRDGFFNIANPFLGYDGNEVAWEHLERGWSAGVSVSGPINGFWGGVARMPELYLDINPTPVAGLPVNYESQTRVGYLGRQAAEYGRYSRPLYPYAYDPGPWADYDTFRLDTYHRLTAPFRTADDVLSVVPRLAYRGTFWHQGGGTDLTGFDVANVGDQGGGMYRSIPEAGVTFAGRGIGWVNDSWQHLVEPYLDVLAQEAFLSGASRDRRPYVFDNLDASVMWEDQFAGRARNLPYSYYGVTPGFRQAWQKLEEGGDLRTVLDFDVYAALQFNQAEWCEDDFYRRSDLHRLAEAGSPNYGESGCLVVPGVRLRWMPDDDLSLLANAEYDAENNKVALADFGWKQKVSKDFSYYAKYNLRDSRWWDYSSSPYRNDALCHMDSDDFNRCYCHLAEAGFQHQPLDWFRWSPFVRWDLADAELDCVGSWFDYLVDCLGFRLILAYKNDYRTIDGYDHRDHFNVGFVVYLRAMGDDGTNIFTN